MKHCVKRVGAAGTILGCFESIKCTIPHKQQRVDRNSRLCLSSMYFALVEGVSRGL